MVFDEEKTINIYCCLLLYFSIQVHFRFNAIAFIIMEENKII